MSIKVLTVHFSIKMVNIVENCCNYTKPTIISALSREAGTELTAENKLCSVSAVTLLAAEHRLCPTTTAGMRMQGRAGMYSQDAHDH